MSNKLYFFIIIHQVNFIVHSFKNIHNFQHLEQSRTKLRSAIKKLNLFESDIKLFINFLSQIPYLCRYIFYDYLCTYVIP